MTDKATENPEANPGSAPLDGGVRPCIEYAMELERHISGDRHSTEGRAALDGLMAEIDRLRNLCSHIGILRAQEHHNAMMAEKDAEIARLTAALKKANEQAEHFERAWYLRGDDMERMAAELRERGPRWVDGGDAMAGALGGF